MKLSAASRYATLLFGYRASTCTRVASASGSQKVISMAREVLWGWGARPMRSLA